MNNIDVTSTSHQETLSPCGDGGTCAAFDGGQVALTSRVESFDIGVKGVLEATTSATYYTAPQHGPIIPTLNPDGNAFLPLTGMEMSVRYTGFTSSPLLRAVFGLQTALDDDRGRCLARPRLRLWRAELGDRR